MDKKFNKILILIFIMFNLSGCYARYSLTIENYSVSEEINIVEKDSSKYLDQSSDSYSFWVNDALNSYTSIYYSKNMNYFSSTEGDGDEIYNKEIINTNGYGIKLTALYTIPSYFSGTAINSCYDDSSLERTDDYISFSTSDKFLCLNKFITADYVKIIITTDYNIIETNAQSNVDGVMTWTIDEDNYESSPINFKIGNGYVDEISSQIDETSSIDDESSDSISKDTSSSQMNTNIEKTNHILLYIFIGFCLVVLTFVTIIYIKYKKHNKL